MAPLYICLAHIIRLFELDYPDKGQAKHSLSPGLGAD
jgi:hypothetical protein